MAGRDALWESGHDESVEVNQRALIDKVLARYSGEFTVFRELLQNSDDAQSKAVEIRFETKEYLDSEESEAVVLEDLPDLKTALVQRWTFKNNGNIFGDADWNRLKKIAEGNPDEEKIGAFGVGFYSLFSVTDDPFVISGGKWMGFYWKDKKDQLYARRGDMPTTNNDDPWTSFEMPLRQPDVIPTPFDFTRFLASSITFMEHLAEVSVYFNDKRLARLTKSVGMPRELGVPKHLKRTSYSGIMDVKGINSIPLHIRAEVMRWVYSAGTEKPPPVIAPKPRPAVSSGFFSSLFGFGSSTPQRVVTPAPEPIVEKVDQLEVSETNVALSVFSAEVDVRLEKKFEIELERSTKKKPPKRLKYKLIYTTKNEYDSSLKEDEKYPFATGSVFQGLRADLDGAGSTRIFIGHATAQTTGLGGHMAARFIPTVERENVDLVDRTIAVWNRELLYVGGFLARSAYEIEMDKIRILWSESASSISGPDPQLQTWLYSQAFHAVKFFTFHNSTPSSDVSSLLEATFFSCSPPEIFPIISTAGVRNVTTVRIPDRTFATFLRQLPVLPNELVPNMLTRSNKSMIGSLQGRGMVKEITFVDVLDELRARPLTEKEMTACLRWWATLMKQGDNPNILQIRSELLNAAVLSIGTPGDPDERIVPLSTVKTFLNTRGAGAYIPQGSPLPGHVMPLSITKEFVPEHLLATFPWRELSLLDWLQHITDPTVAAADVEYDLTISPQWAERVLKDVFLRAWPTMSRPSKEDVSDLLKEKTCVPTTLGMKCPGDSYFANANIFNDLPIVSFPSGAVIKEKGTLGVFLHEYLGVRKHVDLEIVFSRMVKTGNWTISDLVKYLVTVQASLTAEEVKRLRETRAFSKEGEANPLPGQKPPRYRPCDLYEPIDDLRNLGLPIIDWGTQTKWKGSSEEAKFLFSLGLCRYPPLNDVLGLAAGPDPSIRSLALKYFFDHFASQYSHYDPMNHLELPFVPALRGNMSCMGTVKEVFGKQEWARLGFLVVQPHLREDALTKLKIKEQPPTPLLVTYLERTPPKTKREAVQIFEILAGRVPDFSPAQLKHLSQMPIIPITESWDSKDTSRKAPSQCYFDGRSRAQFHSKLFLFVDFSDRANVFLRACGTKNEPSVEEIAQILLVNPREFYEKADGRDNFLIELRNIAVNFQYLSQTTSMRMKRSPILLGSQRKLRKSGIKGKKSDFDDVEEDDWELVYDLRKPEDIMVADDSNAYQFFGDAIFTAPQEDLLEEFYMKLGSPRLSSRVREDYEKSGEIKNSKLATDIRSLILERLPLFLHEHNHGHMRITHNWLNDPKNFIVKTFGKLMVTKSLSYGIIHKKSQDASAAARQLGRGPVELWLAGNAQVDMYEVATSLCRLLFDAPKVNDALLFMTILSTDLRALKRRGYNVDRILRQQKIQKQAAEDAEREKTLQENTALLPEPLSIPQPPPSVPTTTSPASPHEKVISSDNSSPKLSTEGSSTGLGARLGSKFQQTLQNMNITRKSHNLTTNGGPSSSAKQRGITPQSNISHNIDMAIKACTQDKAHLVRNREQMQTVKEANEGYCDISHGIDLNLAGQMGDVRIYVSRDVPETQSIMTTKRDVIARFIHAITPLAVLYSLPLTNLHIFYDIEGPMIAFNRNGSIFLNLRYYESWHDKEVHAGDFSRARISWYFTLAHEIAHNLVQSHNSEHEFYMSAICQEFITPFCQLLSSSS